MRRLQKFAALFAMAAYLSTAFAQAAQPPQKSRLETFWDIAWEYLKSPPAETPTPGVPANIATADLTKDKYLYLYIHNAKAPKDQQITKLEIYNVRASKEDPRSVYGEIRNEKGHTGVVHLRVHRNAVMMDYASTEENRPGYGVLLFREKASGVAGDARVYVGEVCRHSSGGVDVDVWVCARKLCVSSVERDCVDHAA